MGVLNIEPSKNPSMSESFWITVNHLGITQSGSLKNWDHFLFESYLVITLHLQNDSQIFCSDSASLWIIWNHYESSFFTLFWIIWNDFSESFWIVVNYESLWIILIHLESVWIIAWGLDELRGLLCSSLKIILRNFISQQEVFLFLKEHQQASASIKRTQFFLPPPRLVSPNWS